MKTLARLLLFIPSTLYVIWLIIITTIISSLYIVTHYLIPYRPQYLLARLWGYLSAIGLTLFCFLHLKIVGRENIPQQPVIVFSKHQSTAEILVLMASLGPTAWVAKREILRIPIFGWAFGLSRPITIDRNAGMSAVEQLIRQGTQALQEGRNVLIFPEGTRAAAGTKPNYRIGGALLAERTGCPILPIAHNCGEFWPRLSYIKWPGQATFIIGPLVNSKGKKAAQINEEAKSWIEARMNEISEPKRWKR